MVTRPARDAIPGHKLVPPELGPSLVARPGLEARLRRAIDHRLTTVIAGAGFGKSTLLAKVAGDLDWAWYALDRSDEELSSLTQGLVRAWRRRLPTLDPDVLDGSFGTSGGTDVDAPHRVDAIAEQLCEALRDVVTDDVVIVLDDLHEVRPGTPSSRLIGSICRNAPSRLHVVLSSRSEPPFPIQRLRGHGQVLSIGGPQLAMAVEDVEELLTAAVGTADRSLAVHLHEVTGGWPAAVRLATEALRDALPERRVSLLDNVGRRGGPLFDYLAEEVFLGEAPQVGTLLRAAARFDRFTAGLLSSLGVDRAGDTLFDLARRGLFVVPHAGDEEGWFGLHELARSFALARWPLEGDELRAMHLRAAAWFGSDGHDAEALGSLVAGNDHGSVARFIGERGPDLLSAGVVEVVVRAADSLPSDVRDSSVEQVAGHGLAIRGDLDRALECFRRAAGDDGPIGPRLGWRMIMALSFRDDLEEAVAVFGRCRIDRADTADEAMLLAWAASIQMRLGDLRACHDLAKRAMGTAIRCGDQQALSHAHTALALGEAEEGAGQRDAHLRLALEAAERAGDVLQVVRIRNNKGSVLLEACRYAEALEELDEAIRLSELIGYTKLQALALLNRGLANWARGRLDEAAADYAAALSIYRTTGSLEACYALTGLGDIYRERGDLAMARASYQESLPLAERSGDRQGIVPALYQQARLLIDEDRDEAMRLAERAVAYGWPDHAWALNTLGWLVLAAGEDERAATLAAEARSEARERGDLWGLGESLALEAFCSAAPPGPADLLREALGIYRQIGSAVRRTETELALARLSSGPQARVDASQAERRLRELGVHPSAARAAGVLWAVARDEGEPVRVQTLGGFGVVRGGEPVPRSEWRSKKAQDLLKVLVARRGRTTPRDLVMEILWPEEEPEPLPHRLSVALATVRSILDPARRFGSEHFVGAGDDAMWLDTDSLSIDVERFLAGATTGLALRRQGRRGEAVGLLEEAESLYAGEFLEEDLYHDWAAPLREEARATYIAVARALAEDAAASGDHDMAIRYLLRLLERDPFDEEAHLLLVTTLDRVGRHGEARRCYRAYAGRMQEIDVEAHPFPGRHGVAGVAV